MGRVFLVRGRAPWGEPGLGRGFLQLARRRLGSKNGFQCARRVLDSRVEDKEVEVLDLSPETVGTFDLVLFLSVLYHMKHPLLALEKVASGCQRQLILWTQVALTEWDHPAAAFYPDTELNGDPSNWWGPNPPAVEAMLKVVGFTRVQQAYLWHAPPEDDTVTGRGNAVFHSWK